MGFEVDNYEIELTPVEIFSYARGTHKTRMPEIVRKVPDEWFNNKYTMSPWGRIFSRSTPECQGEQPQVVLVPGMIISSQYMIPLAIELSEKCCVHLIDFPGYGKSDKPLSTLSIQELATVLSLWLKTNCNTKVSLVANSFGCQIVAELASRKPDFIDKIVLQGPTVDPSARSILRQFVRLKINSFRESKSVGVISIKDYRAAGLRRVISTIRMTLEDRIEDKLPHIQVPTLVVRGSLDPVSPQAWSETVKSLIPNSELQVIEGAAHTLNYSEPKTFSRVILQFLLGDRSERHG